MSWSDHLDWTTPAGKVVRLLIAALPKNHEFHLTLFGSSPLQIAFEPTFASADVDLFADEMEAEVEAAIERAGLGKEQAAIYVQCCAELNFRTSPRWRTRAVRTQLDGCTITLPHPIDILIAKMHRMAEKDIEAFRLVIARTGHPTEEELKSELQNAVDLYRPNFDEEACSDITNGTRVLWRELWKKEIDVRREIIAPALARRRAGCELDVPARDYKADLRQLGES